MVNKAQFTLTSTVLFISGLAMISWWQIEEIWRSLQNGWYYNLPFGAKTLNYWFAHDFFYVIVAACFFYLCLMNIYLILRNFQERRCEACGYEAGS